MNQFTSFLHAGYRLKEESIRERIATTAIGAQGDSKTIQRFMGKNPAQEQTPNMSPEDFIKKFDRSRS